MDRTSEAWMEAARLWLLATGEAHTADGLPEEGAALVDASTEVESAADVAAALRDICCWEGAWIANALADIDEDLRSDPPTAVPL